MIELGKQYKTRDGCEVRIYAVDGGGRFPVHGAVKLDDGTWRQEEWTLTGSYNGESSHGHTIAHHLDLIEVKPRIQREVWVNVFRHDDGAEFFEACESKANADLIASDARIACVHLKIDVEEGHGL
jgi:hypothetical protein